MKKTIQKTISIVAALAVVLSVAIMPCSACELYETQQDIPVLLWDEENDLACRDD